LSSICCKVSIKLNFVELDAVFQLSGEKMENQKRPRDPLEENPSTCSGKKTLPSLLHVLYKKTIVLLAYLDTAFMIVFFC